MDARDLDLLYSATARCRCGSGLAYKPSDDHFSAAAFPGKAAWLCSKVLKGEEPAELHDVFPWAFYKIREDTSINNPSGATTRPPGTTARTIGKATCPKCGTTWESEPYSACGASHHWYSGACPNCGYDVGGAGSWKSGDGKAIETRYHDVFLPSPETTAA